MQEQHGKKGVSMGADVMFLIIHTAFEGPPLRFDLFKHVFETNAQ